MVSPPGKGAGWLLENDSDALAMTPLHLSRPHDRIMRDDKSEIVRNANLALDFQAGTALRKIANKAIKSACATEGDGSGLQNLATRMAPAFLHGPFVPARKKAVPWGDGLEVHIGAAYFSAP